VPVEVEVRGWNWMAAALVFSGIRWRFLVLDEIVHTCINIIGVQRTGRLNRATSEFVSVRLDPDGVQSGHKDIYWFGHERSYVQWISLRFMLPCTRVLVVGVTNF
jgi:hypothetical protein